MKGLPPSLGALKQEAKFLKKETGQKHAECLEAVARSWGFPNFNGAVRFYERHSPGKDQKP